MKNISLFSGLVLLGILSSCSEMSLTGGPRPLVHQPLTTTSTIDYQPLRLNVVAILPLQSGVAQRIPQDVLTLLSNSLERSIERNASFELIALNNKKSKHQKALEDILTLKITRQEKAKLFAKSVGAQAVIYGDVTKFYDNSSGSHEDNAAGFRLWLYDTALEKNVWEAIFDRSQQPLSDNLFRVREALKEGARYKTALELMQTGFVDVARKLEKDRQIKN